MNNNIKTGEYYKHFKGKNLVEKNIYEIIATKVTYTGEKMSDVKDLVVYKNIFDNKIIYLNKDYFFITNQTELKLFYQIIVQNKLINVTLYDKNNNIIDYMQVGY